MRTYFENVNTITNSLIEDINTNFEEYLFADIAHSIGREKLKDFNDNITVTMTVGVNIEMEPIPLFRLKQFINNYSFFLTDIFHNRTVQRWQDFLGEIFQIFVDLHLAEKRKLRELKTKALHYDFNSERTFANEFRYSINNNFDFLEYPEKQKLINSIINPKSHLADDLKNVHKHVLLRNYIQHKKKTIDAVFLKKLGIAKLEMLNEEGHISFLEENQKISISLPEFNKLIKSMLKIAQNWRTGYEQLCLESDS